MTTAAEGWSCHCEAAVAKEVAYAASMTHAVQVPPSYRPFLAGEARVASVVAYLPEAEPPGLAQLAAALASLGVAPEDASFDESSGDEHVLRVRLDAERSVVIRATAPPLLDDHVRETMHFGAERVAALDAARCALSIELAYSPKPGRPILDFHNQLRLAERLAPTMVGLLDVSAQKLRTPEWVRNAARSRAPPHPTALFTIHCVEQAGGWWMHTHGLQRCAGLELELHAVPQPEIKRAGALLNHVGPRLVEQRFAPDQPFAMSEQVSLRWLPWEEARLGEALRGSMRNPIHHGPAAVLLTHDGRPAWEAAEPFTKSSTYFGSTMGRVHEQLLAQHTFSRFVVLHAQFAQSEGWRFEVKLGGDEPNSEFMWYRVDSVGQGVVSATLVSTPNHGPLVKGMTVNRATHEVADWAIGSPHGPVRPANVDEFMKDRS